MSRKICSKCGSDFECCTESRGCWCETVSLSEKTLLELKEKYDNCLCSTCLLTYQDPVSDNDPVKRS